MHGYKIKVGNRKLFEETFDIVSLMSIEKPRIEKSEIEKNNLEFIRDSLKGAQVRGNNRHPEVCVRNDPKLVTSLIEIGITPFLQDEILTIGSWRDIGILHEFGLIDFVDDYQDFIATNNAAINISFPEVSNEQDNEYQFPVQISGKEFPSYTSKPNESRGINNHEKRFKNEEEVPDSYEQLQEIVSRWEQGVQEETEDKKTHDYTRLPNLSVFKNNEYRWERGVLYKMGGVQGSKDDIREISKEERTQILERAKNGDEKALAEIPKIHIGLVLSIVADLQELYGMEADDMMQAGFEGLMYAIKRHDSNKAAFSTYAAICIDSFIRRLHDDTHRLIRRPRYRNTEVSAYYKASKSLEQELKREPSHLELSKKLGITDKELDEFERQNGIGRQIVGLTHDDQIDSGHISVESPELLPDLDNPVEWESEKKELSEHMEEALQTLTPIEMKVLRLRFGIGLQSILSRYANSESNHLTLEQVANSLSLTRERVRQIEVNALRKLRRPSVSNKFDISL